jgi:uncharacterized membrane protein YfcA
VHYLVDVTLGRTGNIKNRTALIIGIVLLVALVVAAAMNVPQDTAFGIFLILVCGWVLYIGYKYWQNPKLPDGKPIAKWQIVIIWACGAAAAALGLALMIYQP